VHTIPEEMQTRLTRQESTTDAWEVIQDMRLWGDQIKEANTDKLHRDIGEIQFKVGECIQDFTLCAATITNQLCALRDKISDKEMIKKIFHSVPEHIRFLRSVLRDCSIALSSSSS
jgi:hypothetical protein